MKKFRKSIAFKSIAGIIILLAIFTVIVSIIGHTGYTEALLEQYSNEAFQIADAAKDGVDANSMEEYANSNGATKQYKEVWNSLDELCNSMDVTFIYVIQPDLTDYAHITFIFSTINHKSDYTVYDFGYVRETTNDEYKEKYRNLYEGKSEREIVVRDKGYIETDAHITAMVPLKDSEGITQGILCVQRQMDVLTEARNIYIRRVVFALIFLAVVSVIGLGIYLYRMLLRPVNKISGEADRFAKENVAASDKLTEVIKNKDEIGTLAGSIDRMEEQITEYVENIKKISSEKERMNAEMTLASSIQSGVLPDEFPPFPERGEFDIFASMTPAREVGGDFYDYFLIDDDHLYMAIADVSGKGVPAALFMMASKIVLSNNAEDGKDPADILTKANAMICDNNKMEMFVTVWLGILEISTGKLKAASAGHEYPAIRRQKGNFELLKEKNGLVLGGMEGIIYTGYEVDLQPGDVLFQYTDGVTEATDEEGILFGTDRLLESLDKSAEKDPQSMLESINEDINDFVKDAAQFDDITMLCVKYMGTENNKDNPEE